MIEKIDELKIKLINVIDKKLDSEIITSRELFDYAQILSNLKSAEEYKEVMNKAFLASNPNRFNGGNSGFIPN